MDRILRDLMKHHPPHGHLGLENLDEMPGDALSFAVFVSGEHQGIRVLELRFELANDLGLALGQDVEGRKVVLDVDAEAGPVLLLQILRHVGGALREVPYVADTGLDVIVGGEEALNGPRFGR